jgi:hypothetical protein
MVVVVELMVGVEQNLCGWMLILFLKAVFSPL